MTEYTVVTGCASGIGKKVTEKLLDVNNTVIGVDIENPDIKDENFVRICGDITDKETVDSVSKKIESISGGKLDTLVNCAGVGVFSSVEDVETDKMKEIYDVNVFAVHSLTRNLLQYIKTTQGMIIKISSLQANLGTSGLGVYSSSKHALKGLSHALRNELKALGIDVVMIEPGAVSTQFKNNAEYVETSRSEYNGIIDSKEDYKENIFKVESDDVAEKVLKAHQSDNPKPVYRVGWDSRIVSILHRLPIKVQDFVYSMTENTNNN